MHLSEAFELYRSDFILLKNLSEATADNYSQALIAVQKVVGNLEITELSITHIKKWHHYMTAQGFTAGTMRGYMSRLKNVLKFTNRRGITNFDIEMFELPKEPQRLPKYLTPEEIQAMLKATICIRDEALISLMFATALRVTEITRLNRTDIQGNQMTVWGKGNKYRTAIVDPVTLKRIANYLRSRTDRHQALFYSKKKTRLTKSGIESIIGLTGKRAGITRISVTPHLLRHSHATDLLSNGADIRYIQHSLGHAHISTTMIYTHVIDKDYERVYEKFHTVV